MTFQRQSRYLIRACRTGAASRPSSLPCSLGGVTLTIRKFNARRFELEDLIRPGTLDRTVANRLEDYVLQARNILLSGGTGTGKTTLLTALGKFIPPDERILLIEDTAEIQLHHENLVRFEARREQNGTPAVSIRDLLKASLFAIAQTEFCWEKSAAAKHLTFCNS